MRPGCKVIYMNSGLMFFECVTFLSDMQSHLHATSCWPYTICVWCLFAQMLVTQILCDWVVYENVIRFKFWLYLLRRVATNPLAIKDNCKETTCSVFMMFMAIVIITRVHWAKEKTSGWMDQENIRLWHWRKLFVSNVLPTLIVGSVKV